MDPSGIGTKAALALPAGGSSGQHGDGSAAAGRPARCRRAPGASGPFADFDEIFAARRHDAEEFWTDVLGPQLSEDERLLVRQALAGMIWSKQYYGLDVERWLTEHGVDPFAVVGRIRNHEWRHLVADDVISMPDKWEYPWFAAWDLAFHTVALAVVDVGFAKQQLQLLLDRRYLHPNGQLSAYEWNFSDVNPPVHAWATFFVYEIEKARTGRGDRTFLEHSFQKMMKNFVWWLNRKDLDGRNIFQGGFLGLDNIGVFDRSAPLADRRPPGPGGRNGVDGAVHREHDADLPGAVPRGRGLPGPGSGPVRELLLDRRRHQPRRFRRSLPVGRRGRILL